jgi:hypothetical protein
MGRVIRSNRHVVDRPVIVALDLEHDPPTLEPIDLNLNPHLKVVRVGELSDESAKSKREFDTSDLAGIC